MRGRRVGDRSSRRKSTGDGGRNCNLRLMSPILEMTEALVTVVVWSYRVQVAEAVAGVTSIGYGYLELGEKETTWFRLRFGNKSCSCC